jgi:AbiV family abortive infection protein
VKSMTNDATRIHDLCLEHARDLVASAETVLRNNGFANIAYHLAILALEEIGKAGMIVSRAAVGKARDTGWMDKRFEDHVWKIQWAVWSRGFSSSRIDPKDFEEARRFAQSTHNRRLAGLYVDPNADAATALPPRHVVGTDHATSILNLARSRLELESAIGSPVIDDKNEDLTWFLDTINAEQGAKRIFSKPFIDKHEELKGDVRAWMAWVRTEFARIAAEEQEQLQRELARLPTTPDGGKHKWTIRIRLHTPSHSIRPKVLNIWNDNVGWAKLIAVSNKKGELLLEMKLSDTFSISSIYDVGLSASKLCIAALNIGSLGFFWYELPRQTSRYYENIRDVDAPNMDVSVAKAPDLLGDWKQGALSEKNLRHAIECLAAFGSMPDNEAAPVFGPYLKGLLLLSKSDIHLFSLDQARDAFVESLRCACKHFGDWDGIDGNFFSSLHQIFAEIIPDPSHRNRLFEIAAPPHRTAEGPFADAISAKRLVDLYLVLVADRIVGRRIKQSSPSP